MTINKDFVDAMDRSRKVRPISETKDRKSFVCKVFWKSTTKIMIAEGLAIKEDWHFGGKTEVPKSLFFSNEGDRWGRIGFIMMSETNKGPYLITPPKEEEDDTSRWTIQPTRSR